MAYSSTEQVNRLLGPHAATPVTPVTIKDVDELRETVSYRIDAVLRGEGVSTPVTDTAFANYLGTVEAWGVAAHVLKALFPEATGAGEQPAFAYWQRLFDEALEQLPGMIPEGLIALVRAQASSYFTENPDQEAELGALEGAHLFKTDPLDNSPW